MITIIVTINELKTFVTTDETDQQLEFRIQAAESFICKYSNNEFKNRSTGEKDYPDDVKFGVINMIAWDIDQRSKAGISSETISRHSVTYADSSNKEFGYPKELLGFLKPYLRARF